MTESARRLTCGMPGRVVVVVEVLVESPDGFEEPGITAEEASFTTSMRPPNMPPAAAPTCSMMNW